MSVPVSPSPAVLILCRDARFARMLELEVRRMGLTVAVGTPEQLNEALAAPVPPRLLLADLDDMARQSIPQPKSALGSGQMTGISIPVIGWSFHPDWTGNQRSDDMPHHTGDGHLILLSRPFRLDVLEQAILTLWQGTGGCLSHDAGCDAGPAASLPVDAGHGMDDPPPAPLSGPGCMERNAPRATPTHFPICPTGQDGMVRVGETEVSLTPHEWALFSLLWAHRGETVSREALYADLPSLAAGNSVEVYVCRLRAKLEKPLGLRLITAVRHVGYRIDMP